MTPNEEIREALIVAGYEQVKRAFERSRRTPPSFEVIEELARRSRRDVLMVMERARLEVRLPYVP